MSRKEYRVGSTLRPIGNTERKPTTIAQKKLGAAITAALNYLAIPPFFRITRHKKKTNADVLINVVPLSHSRINVLSGD